MLIPVKGNNVSNDIEKEKFTLVHINTKWNMKNDVKIANIPNCKVQYAFLEDQKESFKNTIYYVPVVVLYKGNNPIQQWSADISFQLNISKEDILDAIKRIE